MDWFLHDGTLFIVEDAREVRTALSFLLAAAGYQVRSYGSAERFLEDQGAGVPGCSLLDVRLPGLSGLELQRALAGSLRALPIAFLSGTGDIDTGVRAMKAGAVDFLSKPIDGKRLIAAVKQAIQRDAEQHQKREIHSMIHQRCKTSTRCERRLMTLVIRGLLNKQIAVEVETRGKTVKRHRERVMSKTRACSVAELVTTRRASRSGY